MKGIILAGGYGTRLYPATSVVCKQLLPVYYKPMICYPLSILMLAGIREILIISTPQDLSHFKALFRDGSALGLSFCYEEQHKLTGIAEAFVIGENFISGDNVCLILGDNIFFGHDLSQLLQECVAENEGATIFGYWVKNPEQYGVIEFDENRKVRSVEEKPKSPKSHYAIVGLHFYDNQVSRIAKCLKPSARGEKEITDLNSVYLDMGKLRVKIMGRGYAWLDTGTHNSLVDAAIFVRTLEERQGLKIACVEEIAYQKGYITADQLEKLAVPLLKSGYGEYLLRIARDT